MITIHNALLKLTESFREHFANTAKQEAENLLSWLLNISRAKLFSENQKKLTIAQWECCQEWAVKRLQDEPLQYLHGEVEFYDCRIKVDSHVLIPRHETEILVDNIVQTLSRKEVANQVLWDLCTGSGCIAIALKKQFPNLEVFGSDISIEAIKKAEANAKLNNVTIQFLLGDLFAPFKNLKTNYFICNPPYISLSAYQNLEKSVLLHEPQLALLGGNSGLEFYVRLEKELPHYLISSGLVWLEIGYDQGENIKEIFKSSWWKNQRVEKDWAGHERFFLCQFN